MHCDCGRYYLPSKLHSETAYCQHVRLSTISDPVVCLSFTSSQSMQRGLIASGRLSAMLCCQLSFVQLQVIALHKRGLFWRAPCL